MHDRLQPEVAVVRIRDDRGGKLISRVINVPLRFKLKKVHRLGFEPETLALQTSILPLMVAGRARTRATQSMRTKVEVTQAMMGTLVRTEMRSRLSRVVRMVKVAQMKVEHLPSQKGQGQMETMPDLQQPGSAQGATT